MVSGSSPDAKKRQIRALKTKTSKMPGAEVYQVPQFEQLKKNCLLFFKDAITVLELASKYDQDNSAIYFTMGNVYATLMQFNESAKAYSQALKFQPRFNAAKIRRHAVLCHFKLEQALEEQHRSLEVRLYVQNTR
jgi:tetratricopeptide (TPR) repeat protein